MNSIRNQVFRGLQSSSEYRHAFVQESIAARLTAQIKGLRSNMDYKQFADRIGKKVSWAYRLEDPNAPLPTIPTLLEIAGAFDIALDVRFCRYSEVLDDVSTLDEHSFTIPSFENELNAGVFSSQRKRKRRIRGPQRRKPRSSEGSANSNRQVSTIPIGGMQTHTQQLVA
jgi:transcriptional regulator with XRE-family HTH domain